LENAAIIPAATGLVYWISAAPWWGIFKPKWMETWFLIHQKTFIDAVQFRFILFRL
jgi:hypothetical protein